jgi:putative transposase
LIHHTDRGAIYSSGEYRQALMHHGLRPSMGRKGDCYDNAAAESFFSTLKNELIHGLRLRDQDHARCEIVPFIEGFYNRKRIHQAIQYVSPVAFEERFGGSGLICPKKAG